MIAAIEKLQHAAVVAGFRDSSKPHDCKATDAGRLSTAIVPEDELLTAESDQPKQSLHAISAMQLS